jgi:hypothetical protein
MHADSRRYWSQGAIIKTRPGDSHKFQSADGGFRIDGLVAHDKDAGGPYYYLNVSAAGYAKHVLRSIKPKPNENKDLGDVKLEAGASVAGTVNDLHTRNPIPGTLVYLENKTRNLRSFPGIVRNTTDELGRYQLEGVPQGDQYIIASHPDYAIGISEKAEIQEASEYESVDILLGSGGTVEGKVSEEENPLEGVMIGICPIDTPYFEVEKTTKLGPEFQTATDINGGYRINGVTAGYCLISARIPMPTQYAGKKSPQEYVKRFQEVVELQEGETTIFNIDICLGSTVGGKLIGEDPPGTLIPINVYLRPSDAPPIGLDNDGTLILHVPSIEITGTSRGHWYKFEDVCPGDYTITAFCRCTSEMTIWQTSIPVTIKSEEAFQLDIDCTDPAVDTCDSVDLKIKQ